VSELFNAKRVIIQ